MVLSHDMIVEILDMSAHMMNDMRYYYYTNNTLTTLYMVRTSTNVVVIVRQRVHIDAGISTFTYRRYNINTGDYAMVHE